MRNFVHIASGIDTVPALLELHRNPSLWDTNKLRTEREGTPHDVSDIWVRYRPVGEGFDEPGDMQWYPAWQAIPALRSIVFGLMARVQAVELGGVLMTRIQSGARVHPHRDGNWHALRYETKVYVPLQTNPLCVNECGGEAVTMAAGSAWTFDNTVSHSVTNNGDDDRITLIVCMRTQ